MEPGAYPGQDIRGSYEVSWWITYQRGDSTVAKALCPGSLMIDEQGPGEFSGTATVSPEGGRPCVAATVPIRGTLERAASTVPYGQDEGWRLHPTVEPVGVFGDCTFIERSPAMAARTEDRGVGQLSPNGQIDLLWFRDVYECSGTRYGLEASLNGQRDPA
jgi:hypothetical protein